MDIKRRQFIKTTLAGLGSVTAGAEVAAARAIARADESPAPPKNPFSTDPVATIKLTDAVTTSRVGFGTGMSGHQRSAQLTRMDRDKAEDLVRYAYDSGVRFFDCADLYGTHQLVVEALKDKPRDSYQISSKLWPHPGGIPEQERPTADVVVKRFLEELKTDYIDLVQIHCMMKPNWQEDFASYMEDLEKLKEQGIIRGHGISCHSLGAIQSGVVDPWVDALHIRINTTGARMEGTFEENVAAGKTAQANGKGVIAMKLIGEGTIRERKDREECIDKIVRADIVDVYVVGFEEKWQVDEIIENLEKSLKGIEAERKAADA
jgi:aryl-alcohol dehydrogenase-like predicted oxidoreductase